MILDNLTNTRLADEFEIPFSSIKDETGNVLTTATKDRLPIDMVLCSKCLTKHTAYGRNNCEGIFSNRIHRKRRLLIVKLDAASHPRDKAICQHLSILAMIDSNRSTPEVTKADWSLARLQFQVFMLLDDKAIAGYLVFRNEFNVSGRLEQCNITDMFIAAGYRKQGHMRYLLLEALKQVHLSFDKVFFRGRVTYDEIQFLEKIAKELDLKYSIS